MTYLTADISEFQIYWNSNVLEFLILELFKLHHFDVLKCSCIVISNVSEFEVYGNL